MHGENQYVIPGQFEYKRPASKAEALQMLSDIGDDGRPLAGGHSLIPMMKLRMAAPSVLVDVGKIDELRGIQVTPSEITIGAATTQHEMISSQELATACPIIREAALLIADPQVRYCGTLGGNVGNGDPGNDMPGLMQCLNARFVLEKAGGVREVAARDYYQGAYFTSLETGELIVAVKFPTLPSGHGYAYTKLKRKVGDYATAAAGVIVLMSGGKVTDASIAMTNVADTPLYAADAAAAIKGTSLEEADIAAAVQAAEAITNPTADGRGSAEYRTKMAGVMVRRALELAKTRAGDAGPNAKLSAPAAASPSQGTNQNASQGQADDKNEGGVFGWLKR